jgi:hypothetical protein
VSHNHSTLFQIERNLMDWDLEVNIFNAFFGVWILFLVYQIVLFNTLFQDAIKWLILNYFRAHFFGAFKSLLKNLKLVVHAREIFLRFVTSVSQKFESTLIIKH